MLRGINPHKSLYYSPKPRSNVYYFKLNFNRSKLGDFHLRGKRSKTVAIVEEVQFLNYLLKQVKTVWLSPCNYEMNSIS